MYIEVARVPPEGLEIEGSDDRCFAGESSAGFLKVLSPITYMLKAFYVSGELVVTGTIEADMEFPCSRCAVPFVLKVRDSRFEACVEAPQGTESVDLTADMREAILCAFPSHPVCRDECKGLCAQCGTDLNNGICECSQVRENRWESLEGLKL